MACSGTAGTAAHAKTQRRKERLTANLIKDGHGRKTNFLPDLASLCVFASLRDPLEIVAVTLDVRMFSWETLQRRITPICACLSQRTSAWLNERLSMQWKRRGFCFDLQEKGKGDFFLTAGFFALVLKPARHAPIRSVSST